MQSVTIGVIDILTNQIWRFTIITLIRKNYCCHGLKLLQRLQVQSVTIGVIDIFDLRLSFIYLFWMVVAFRSLQN